MTALIAAVTNLALAVIAWIQYKEKVRAEQDKQKAEKEKQEAEERKLEAEKDAKAAEEEVQKLAIREAELEYELSEKIKGSDQASTLGYDNHPDDKPEDYYSNFGVSDNRS